MNTYPSKARLWVQSGRHSGASFSISTGTYYIGSDPTNQFVLADEGIAPRHAQIVSDPQGVWIADLGSGGGTFVNGVQITGSNWLYPNDVVRLGPVVSFIYQTAAPPSGAGAARPAAAKKSRSCTRNCLMPLLIAIGVFFCLALILGGGGYYFYSTGQLSLPSILNTIGFGTGDIELINLADSAMQAELLRLDTESGEPDSSGRVEVEPFDISNFASIEPGEYQLNITLVGGQPPDGNCQMQVASGDVYRIVAVPPGIVITREGAGASTAEELDFATSPLCSR